MLSFSRNYSLFSWKSSWTGWAFPYYRNSVWSNNQASKPAKLTTTHNKGGMPASIPLPTHPCAEIGSYLFLFQRKWNVGFINITTIQALLFFSISNISLHATLFMEHWKMLERQAPSHLWLLLTKFTNPKRTINCHPTKYDSNSSGIFKGPLGHIRVNGDSGSRENTNETVIDSENGFTWLWLPWKPIFLSYVFFSSSLNY